MTKEKKIKFHEVYCSNKILQVISIFTKMANLCYSKVQTIYAHYHSLNPTTTPPNFAASEYFVLQSYPQFLPMYFLYTDSKGTLQRRR